MVRRPWRIPAKPAGLAERRPAPSVLPGYADYMQTPPFNLALDALLKEGARQPTAIMCSETLWWRCHRRLIADALVLLHGVDVGT